MENLEQNKSFDLSGEGKEFAVRSIKLWCTMKKLTLSLMVVLSSWSVLALTTSCENVTSSDFDDTQMVDVTVNFSDLDITTEAITRASDTSVTGAGVTRVNLAVYDQSGNLVKDTIQNKDTDPTNFGQSITMRLPVGSCKFVAVAHKVANTSDPAATINSATEVSFGTMSISNPTYTTVQDATIAGNTTQSVTIDMGTRKNATFALKITDTTPADVTSLEIIVNPTATAYTNLLVNPATGLATSSWQYKRTILRSSIPQEKGTTYTNNSFALPLFLTAASEALNVTINALNANNEVLYTRTLTGVTFQQTHRTLASGTFFSPETNDTFMFDKTETTDDISLD